ncbi:MAG TPA: LacI family DNA-binding transcriptional regulator [Bacteroidota bacterium]|nr:LacI family DNA-binding transcriptional regulator [Bacteroidota bacterium]
MKQRPTIEDVARRVSLSISTVSLVLNDKPNVSEETRRKVKKAIRDLGYHPHRTARGLASQSSGNIGFILTENHFQQSEPFYTRIFLGTEFAARENNYYILLTTVGNGDSIPRFLLERNVDGVIIAGRIDEQYVDGILSMGVPVVLVDFVIPLKKVSAVLIDNRRGAATAVEHLIGQYGSDIGFIGGDMSHPSIAERYEGYKEALRLHQLSLANTLIDTREADTGVENGYRAAVRLLAAAKPKAIFAANDALALGCMRYLKERGLKIPGEIGIAGFDDIEASSHVEPRLTTVRVFKEEMGRVAVQQLMESIKSKSETVVTVHVPVELVVNQSSVILND